MITITAALSLAALTINGLAPGASTQQVKAAGYTDCHTVSDYDNTMQCNAPKPHSSLAGLPISASHVLLKPPYNNVDTVSATLNHTRQTNKCLHPKRGTGRWADVRPADDDCMIDISTELGRLLGPLHTDGYNRHGTKLHQCGARTLLLKDNTITLSEDSTYVSIRQSQCADKASAAIKKQQEEKTKQQFIDTMKK